MSTCQITRDSAKNIVEVVDSLGNPSRLYQQALAFTDNPEMSANLVVAAENPAIIDYYFPSGASSLKSTFKEVVKNPSVINDLRSLIGLENTKGLIINDTQKSVIYDEIEKEVFLSGNTVAKEFANRMRMGDLNILKGLRNSLYDNHYVRELTNTIINSEEAKPFNEEFAKRSINNDAYIVDNIDNLIKLESLFDDTEVKFDKALDFYKNAISSDITQKEMTLSNSRENLKVILGNQFPVNEIVDTMIDTGMTYGYFEESAIYLSNVAPYGTEYHEAFHAVFRTMLSDKQVAEYLELAKQEMDLSTSELQSEINKLRKTYPDLTDSQLENLVYEEYMADSYMDFAVKDIPTTSALVALFNLIKNFILTLIGNRTKIQGLYYKLSNRGFKQTRKQPSLSKFLLPIRMYKNLKYVDKGSKEMFMLSANESLSLIQNLGARLFDAVAKSDLPRTEETYKKQLKQLIGEEYARYSKYVLKSTGENVKNTNLAAKHLQKEGVLNTPENTKYDELLAIKKTNISDKAKRLVGALDISNKKTDNMATIWDALRDQYAAVPNNPFIRAYSAVQASEAVDSLYREDNQGNDDMARYDMSANEKGGFDIISSELKAFYSLLTKTSYDDFLFEDVVVSVDGQALHGNLITALSNRDLTNKDVYDTLNTMSNLAGNQDIKALLTKVQEYSMLDPEGGIEPNNIDYNSQILNQLRSAYQLYDKQRDSMLIDSNKKAIMKVSDETMVNTQLERWASAWGATKDSNEGLSKLALGEKGDKATDYLKKVTFLKHALSGKFNFGFFTNGNEKILQIEDMTIDKQKQIASVLSGASMMTYEAFFNVVFGDKRKNYLSNYLDSVFGKNNYDLKALVPSFQTLFGMDLSPQTVHLLITSMEINSDNYNNYFAELVEAQKANVLGKKVDIKKGNNPNKTIIENIAKELFTRVEASVTKGNFDFYNKEVADTSSVFFPLTNLSEINSVFDNRYVEFSTQTADKQTVYSFMLDAYNARSVRELGKDGFKRLKEGRTIRRNGKLNKYGKSVQSNYFVAMPEALQKAIFTEDNDSKPIDAGDIRQDAIKETTEFVGSKSTEETESKIGKTAKTSGNKEYMLLRVGNFASRLKKTTTIDGKQVTFVKAKYIPGVYEAKNQIELKSLPVGFYNTDTNEFEQFLPTKQELEAYTRDMINKAEGMMITDNGVNQMYSLFTKELSDMNSILSFITKAPAKENDTDPTKPSPIAVYKEYYRLSNAVHKVIVADGIEKSMTSAELIEFFEILKAKATIDEDQAIILEALKSSQAYKAYESLLAMREDLGNTENHLIDGFHIAFKKGKLELGRAFDNWNFKFVGKENKEFAEQHKAVKSEIEKQLNEYFFGTSDTVPVFTENLFTAYIDNKENQNSVSKIKDSIVKHLREDFDKLVAAYIEEGLLSTDDKGRLVNELLPIPVEYKLSYRSLLAASKNKPANELTASDYAKTNSEDFTIKAFLQDMVMNQFFNVTNYNNMVDVHPAIAKNAADRVKRYGGHVAYGKRSLEGSHTVAYVEKINLEQDDLFVIKDDKVIFGSDFIKKEVADYYREEGIAGADNPEGNTDIALIKKALDAKDLLKKERADAQAYTTFERAMSINTQLGRAKKEVIYSSFQVLEDENLSLTELSPIAKIRFGLPLTWSEKSLLEDNTLIFNSIKGVYYDAERYHKLSYAILTRELTSYIPKDKLAEAKALVEKIVILEEKARRYSKDRAKNIAEAKALELVYEDMLQPLPGRLKTHNLRRAMLTQGVDEVLPQSASKLNSTMMAKPQNGTYDFSYTREVLANDHWALQVEMPTGKTMVTYFTQMISLIDNEQLDDNVEIKGMKLKEVKEAYQKALADRVKNAVEMALSELTKVSETDSTSVVTFEKFDENTVVDYENLISRLQETLIRSGADDSLLEFFKIDASGKPKHDLNSFSIEAKFQQLFNAMFSDGVLKAKSFGRKMSLISDYGFDVVRDANDKVIPMHKVLENPEKYSANKKSRLKWSEMKATVVFKDTDGLYKDVDKSNMSEASKSILNEAMKLKNIEKNSSLKIEELIEIQLRMLIETNQINEDTKIDYLLTLSFLDAYEAKEEKAYTLAEIMMPAHTRELHNLKIGDTVPADLLEGFGVRIPTQDKHSMIAFKVVDFLPVYMGDVCVAPAEIAFLSGADYDIDSLYTLLTEYYTEKNEDGETELIAFNSTPRDTEANYAEDEEAYKEYTDRLYKEYLIYQEMYNSNYARIKSIVVNDNYDYNLMKAEYDAEYKQYKEFRPFDNLLSINEDGYSVANSENVFDLFLSDRVNIDDNIKRYFTSAKVNEDGNIIPENQAQEALIQRVNDVILAFKNVLDNEQNILKSGKNKNAKRKHLKEKKELQRQLNKAVKILNSATTLSLSSLSNDKTLIDNLNESNDVIDELFRKFEVKKNYVNGFNAEASQQELDKAKQKLELEARKKARIYSSVEEFVKAWEATAGTPEERRDMNNASVGNALVRINTMLYSNETMRDIALTPSSMDLIDSVVAPMLNYILGTEASTRPLNTVMGQTETKHANAVGKILIGPAAITNITKSLLSKYFRNNAMPKTIKGAIFETGRKITIQDKKGKDIEVDEYSTFSNIGDYETTELSIEKDPTTGRYVIVNKPGKVYRTMDIISTVLSSATDNVKNNGMANMRFDINLLPTYLYMVSMGTGLNRVGLVSAQPIMKLFSKYKNDERPDNIQTEEQRKEIAKTKPMEKAINEMLDYITDDKVKDKLIAEGNAVDENRKKKQQFFPKETDLLQSLQIIGDISKQYGVSNDIDAIMKVLAKQSKKDVAAQEYIKAMIDNVIPIQIKVLRAFNGMKSEVSAFTRASKLIGLNKGLKPTHFENNAVEAAIDEQNAFFDEGLLINQNASLDTNLEVVKKIVNVFAAKVCTSQTPFVKEVFKQLQNLYSQYGSGLSENIENLQKQIVHFLQLKAYLHADKSGVNKFIDKLPLLFSSGADGMKSRLNNVIAENPELATNAFIKSLNNSFKSGKDASVGLNILKINSRFKESTNVVNKKINAFEEMLYSPKPEVRDFAKDLVDYLILKDGLNYRNGSYLKYVPASALQELSDATKPLVLNGDILGKSKDTPIEQLLLVDNVGKFKSTFGMDKQDLINEFIYTIASQKENALLFNSLNFADANKSIISEFEKFTYDEVDGDNKEPKLNMNSALYLFMDTPVSTDNKYYNESLFEVLKANDESKKLALLKGLSASIVSYLKTQPLIVENAEKTSFDYKKLEEIGLDKNSEIYAFINGLIKNDDLTVAFCKQIFDVLQQRRQKAFDKLVRFDADQEGKTVFANGAVLLPRVIVTENEGEVRKVYTIKKYNALFDNANIDEEIKYYESVGKAGFDLANSLERYKKILSAYVVATEATYELVSDEIFENVSPFAFSSEEERIAAHSKLVEIRTKNAELGLDEKSKEVAIKSVENFAQLPVKSGKVTIVGNNISGGNSTDIPTEIPEGYTTISSGGADFIKWLYRRNENTEDNSWYLTKFDDFIKNSLPFAAIEKNELPFIDSLNARRDILLKYTNEQYNALMNAIENNKTEEYNRLREEYDKANLKPTISQQQNLDAMAKSKNVDVNQIDLFSNQTPEKKSEINQLSANQIAYLKQPDTVKEDAVKITKKVQNTPNSVDSNIEFSNFSRNHQPIIDDMGIAYPSVENYYQAQKSLNKEERLKFVRISDYEAKSLGKTIKVRNDWDIVKFDVMYKGLKQKFNNPQMREKLLSTGNSQIVEWTYWGDKIWGVAAQIDSKNNEVKGNNALGKLLMIVREELKDKNKAPETNASDIYNKLGNKTQSENVVINPSVYQESGAEYAKSIDGVFSMRVNKNDKHFGNPFSSVQSQINIGLIATKTTKESVEKYIDWVINSQEDRAKWIREILKSGQLKGKPIVYYKELNEPSHATALDYLINKYNWNNQQTPEQKNIAVNKHKYTFKGYVSVLKNKSTGNWYGDAKDEAMRDISGGFIGESTREKTSIFESSMVIESQFHDEPVSEDSVESFFVKKSSSEKIPTLISGGTVVGEIVMLARDEAFSSKPLDENTKQAIKDSHEKGSTFVVGDMPNVDSQFIDYLKEIGATFEIYHTSDTPRIIVDKAPEQRIDNTNKFEKKNIFTVTPIKTADKKAITKASIATQYIGFAEGIEGSSTELYRQQIGELANTGKYSPDDVIFVSIGGNRGTEQQRKEQQDKTIKEALKAIEAGATLITDNKAYIDSSSYNTGEKRLYANLEAKGYKYSETTVDGQLLGVWNKTPEQQSNETIDNSSSGAIKQQTQTETNTQLTDEQKLDYLKQQGLIEHNCF